MTPSSRPRKLHPPRNALKWLESSVDDRVNSKSDIATWHLIRSKETILKTSLRLLTAERYSRLRIPQAHNDVVHQIWSCAFSLSFCGAEENASVYPAIKRGNFLHRTQRLSFSSMGSKDDIYEEIKEHLRLNEPLGAAVSLLLEPCRPTADISLCHSHHSNAVISPIRSAVALANTHTRPPRAPSHCSLLWYRRCFLF